VTTPTATPLSVPAVPTSSAVQGRFLWYDLMTPDPDAAQRFYTAVVGWGTQPFEMAGGGQPYVMWTASEVPIGGTMLLPNDLAAQGVPAHWLCYIGTEDVDATVSAATSLGAKVLTEPFDIPEVGRIAVLADPFGSVFAVYRPGSQPNSPDEAPKAGQVGWHEFLTLDYNRAFEFYRSLFGWELASDMDMGGGEMYRLYARNGRQLGGIFNRPKGLENVPPHLGIYVVVDDVHAAVERVKANGGVLANGPMEVPGGSWIANCIDPQGAGFSVMQSPKS
jgi:predicted enzyme related to lactoylglutathione lyase